MPFKPLGLAAMSCASADPHLMHLAESAYISSIRSMNTALFDPVEAKKDVTLLGVLILTVFETISNSENRDLVAWASHINGTAALLEMRQGAIAHRPRHGSSSNSDDKVILLGYCHIFEHFRAAERHNRAWASRILLNQMIRSVMLLGFTHRLPFFSSQVDTDLFHEATANLAKV
ncbi:hypothetical protein DV737_g1454, partial [Chaetothyriales sp. CBS 132003]